VKSSRAALGVVGLLVATLWYLGGGTAIPAQSAAAGEQPRVSDPVSHDNLTVFFIHGPDAVANAKVATLQEALAAGWAVVHETGDVNVLAVENRSSDTELFIEEGDIIKGGRQDRMIAVDMLLPPKSGAVSFPAHCVEHGRWTNRGTEAATHFSSSNKRGVRNDLRIANASGQQGQVWATVTMNQDKLTKSVGVNVNAAASASSFQLSLENPVVEAKVKEYTTALKAVHEEDKTIIGAVFLVNGQLRGAEVYGSNALFRKAWPKLLDSQATDALVAKAALSEKSDKPAPPTLPAPSIKEVERYLAFAGQDTSPAGPSGTPREVNGDLTNDDLGLVVNLQQPRFAGRSGATRNVLLNNSGGNTVNPTANADLSRLQNFYGSRGIEVAAPNMPPNQNRTGSFQFSGSFNTDQNINDPIALVTPSAPALPVVVNVPGNRLNVQRVEDRSGLVTESRDPSRQNAVIHRSYIKK